MSTPRSRRTRHALALIGPLIGAQIIGSACAHTNEASAAERQAIVANNIAELQDCWDELAASQPGSSGSILFSVELRRNGTVEWVEIEVDEIGVAKLSACAVRRIKRWRFPEDRKRRSISFGVGFRASD